MTEAQHTKIRDYLLSRKLPFDILVEVQDHFISQINEIMQERNLDFETAFESVKISWKPELRMVYNPNYSLDDISILTKKLLTAEMSDILKICAFATVAVLVLLSFVSGLLTQPVFYAVFGFLVILSIGLPIIQYYRNLKNFCLIKKYQSYKLTFYQNYSGLTVVFVVPFVPFIFNLKGFSGMMFESLRFSSDDGFSYSSVPLFSLIFFLNAFCYLNQKKYLRQIEKVKPFLASLKM